MFKHLRYVSNEPVTNRARYWLFHLMNESGETTEELEKAGFSRKTVWSFVSNGRTMTLERLAELAEHLGLDVEDLFRPTPEEVQRLNTEGRKVEGHGTG